MTTAAAPRSSPSEAPRRSPVVYAVKRRLVLAQASLPARADAAVRGGRLAVCVYSGVTPAGHLPAHQLETLAATVGEERLARRLAHPDVTLVLGVDRASQRPTGFRWVLHPRDEVVWHDNVPVTPGIAYGFNAFTYPEYRRQGLYKELVREGNRYLFEEVGCAKVTIVVEAGNQASLKANQDAGYAVEATNYLVKVLRRNVLSAFRDHASGAVRVHWVYRRGATSGL